MDPSTPKRLFTLTGFALAFGTLFSSQGAPPKGPETGNGRRTRRQPPGTAPSLRPALGSLPVFGCQEELGQLQAPFSPALLGVASA
jgi:hypothetical protein